MEFDLDRINNPDDLRDLATKLLDQAEEMVEKALREKKLREEERNKAPHGYRFISEEISKAAQDSDEFGEWFVKQYADFMNGSEGMYEIPEAIPTAKVYKGLFRIPDNLVEAAGGNRFVQLTRRTIDEDKVTGKAIERVNAEYHLLDVRYSKQVIDSKTRDRIREKYGVDLPRLCPVIETEGSAENSDKYLFIKL